MESNQILAGGLQALAESTSEIPRYSAVRSLVCPLCWAASGRTCTITSQDGDHLVRYRAAEKAGLITRAELTAVVAGLEVIADHVMVRGAA